MFFGGYGYPASFEQNYVCYSATFIGKSQLESGDKIIMPPSALDRLASLHIDYPMVFELHNPSTVRTSHCGVLEFVAEEGMIYLPYWMMQNMLLGEGDTVRVKNATLLKGTYVKLQPHTQDFLDISNPKAVLETTLRNFSCLTTGDSIMVAYNNKNYYIDIIETRPASAISIIETDCEVDFAPPLDYKEPERASALPSAVASTTTSQGERKGGSSTTSSSNCWGVFKALQHYRGMCIASGIKPASSEEPKEMEEAKFSPFTGVGRRLDGKPLKYSVAPITSGTSDARSQAANSKSSEPSSSASASRQHTAGKLVFGPGTGNAPVDASKAAVKEVKEEVPKEEPKFKAFTGKKYSLKD